MKTRIAGLAFLSIIAALGTGCLAVEREHWSCSESGCMMSGEARNNTDAFYGWVNVVGTFYDAAGNVVGSDSSATCTDLVNPHDSAPFGEIGWMNVDTGPPEVASYKIEVQGQPMTDVLPNHLSLEEFEVSRVGYAMGCGAPSVAGTVRNNGDVVYDRPKVCVAFYNEGQVVWAGSASVYREPPPNGPLFPGQSGRFWVCPPGGFGVETGYSRIQLITHVRLWVDGKQQGATAMVMPISTEVIPVPPPP